MSKHWNREKTKVGLKPPTPKPSRIRREPVAPEKPATLEKALWRHSQEWEIGLAIVGMVLFALGIDAAMYLFAGFVSH